MVLFMGRGRWTSMSQQSAFCHLILVNSGLDYSTQACGTSKYPDYFHNILVTSGSLKKIFEGEM